MYPTEIEILKLINFLREYFHAFCVRTQQFSRIVKQKGDDKQCFQIVLRILFYFMRTLRQNCKNKLYQKKYNSNLTNINCITEINFKYLILIQKL